MNRPVSNQEWEMRKLEYRERTHLRRSILKAFGVLMFLLVAGVTLVGLKFMRKLSKTFERHQQSMQQYDSMHNAWDRSKHATMEDSLEKIDLRKATVTGLRGYEDIEIPYTSHRDSIERMLGRADSAVPSAIACDPPNKSLLYYYRGNIIQIDGEDKAMMRSMDLLSNPSLKLNAGQFILSRATTLEGYKRRFPFSADHKLPQGYYGLRPVRRKPGEFLHLTFDKQGRLAYIHYYTGC